MASHDHPTPLSAETEPGRSDASQPDLPLSSIPSVPDDPLAEPERKGLGSYVVAGAGIFVLIIAISLLGARYLKLPKQAVSVEPAEEHAVGGAPSTSQPAAAEAPAATAAAAPAAPAVKPAALAAAAPPLSPPVTQAVTVSSPPDESPALRREIAARSRQVADLEKELEKERTARRVAEKKLDDARRAAAADKGGKAERGAKPTRQEKLALDKKTKAKLQDLEKKLAEAKKSAEAAEAKSSSGDAHAKELQTKLEAAERRAKEAEAATRTTAARQSETLKGENDAVRKLVADLNTARDHAATEKAAREEAEKKAHALEAEVERLRRASETSSAPAPRREPSATSAAAPAHRETPATTAADVKEPERVKTVPPRYPDALRHEGVGGRVLLRVLVSDAGAVEDVQVKSSPDERLSKIAVDAARRWQYSPGRKDGVRATMWVAEAVDFKL